MRISDWSSDVCSSDLGTEVHVFHALFLQAGIAGGDVIPVRDVGCAITKPVVTSLGGVTKDVGVDVGRQTESGSLESFRLTGSAEITDLDEVCPAHDGAAHLSQFVMLRTKGRNIATNRKDVDTTRRERQHL